MRNAKARFLAAPYVVWMALFIIVPLAVVVFFAFTDPTTGQFTVSNLGRMNDHLQTFGDSIWLALVATVICLFIGYPVAYAISKASPTQQRMLVMLIMLPMCMSFLLRTIAWVAMLEDTGMINRFFGALGLGPFRLIRTPGAVILGMVYNYLPYMILPLHSILAKLDHHLVESAQDLGCNGAKVLTKVILPLSVPGIIAGVTMVFVPAVSTFYISQKLGNSNTRLIGDVIEEEFKQAYNPNLGAALSLVLMLLIFLCMWIMNRFTDSDEVLLV